MVLCWYSNCVGRRFLLLPVFPYTGVYFCFGFLQEVTKLFCTSPPPTFSTVLILYCVDFYCFSTHQFRFCFLTISQTPAVYPHLCTFSTSDRGETVIRRKRKGKSILDSKQGIFQAISCTGTRASGTKPARGYPGYQNRVSIKAPRRRES